MKSILKITFVCTLNLLELTNSASLGLGHLASQTQRHVGLVSFPDFGISRSQTLGANSLGTRNLTQRTSGDEIRTKSMTFVPPRG